MNNEEKSLRIIQKEGIFAKIIKFFRKVFINDDKKVDTILNPDTEERKKIILKQNLIWNYGI